MKTLLALLVFIISIGIISRCKPVDVGSPRSENVDTTSYSCTGKTHCTEMKSCKEAEYYLKNCPNVEIDGDGDGTPCEEQWCVIK
jgi:hypothetical protein